MAVCHFINNYEVITATTQPPNWNKTKLLAATRNQRLSDLYPFKPAPVTDSTLDVVAMFASSAAEGSAFKKYCSK